MTLERLKSSWNQFESITTDVNKTNPLPPTADSQIIDKKRFKNTSFKLSQTNVSLIFDQDFEMWNKNPFEPAGVLKCFLFCTFLTTLA